jgi:hypothetical protein
MPTLLERFNILFGPGVLAGITFGDWLALLRDNRFRISPRHIPRSLTVTGSSLLNTPARWMERLRYRAQIDATPIPAPLFILGHYRSGTTLLHDLLTVDDRFAFPNLYQAIYPNTFLTSERFGSKMLRRFSPAHRPQDNMSMDPASAWEDEFALCAWGGISPYLGWAFPGRCAHYDRFLTFTDATEQELRLWRESMTAYLRKLCFKHGKPLILKSPTHTARIRLLLEMFPNARFVHIHRNPYDVFRSCRHLWKTVIPMIRLQRSDATDWDERTIRVYKEMHEAFFAQRPLIPAGCYHEIAFEGLEKDPLGEIRRTYESLRLPDFAHVEPGLRAYVDSIAQYQKNTYSPLPAETHQRIASEWGRCFDEWGYER